MLKVVLKKAYFFQGDSFYDMGRLVNGMFSDGR